MARRELAVTIAAGVTGLTLLAPGVASASGLSSARFGGEHGHPTTDNPTALYYNPAGIASRRGTRIFVDATMALRWASYQRPASAVNSDLTLQEAPGANDGKATLFNTIAGPFAGATSDFGTKIFSAGAAAYFPFGGQAVWDRNTAYAGNKEIPGAVDGVQRWYTIDGTIRSMYLTGGFAFRFPSIGLSIGFTGSAIKSGVNTIRARNADGSDDVLTAADTPGNLKEGRSMIDVSGWQGGFSAGALWEWREKLWIGASYTSQPNVVGGMELKGELVNVLGVAKPETTQVALTQTLPDILRLGFRVRPLPRLELRVFGDYTRWSVFDKQCVMKDVPGRRCDFGGGATALDRPGDFGEDTPTDPAHPEDDPERFVVQHLPRFWKDAGGVRVGASYWFLDSLEGYLGAGYDSSAIPVKTLDPAIYDMNKVSLSVGARWQVIRNLGLALTFTEILYMKVDTKGTNVLNKFKAPTRQASADGIYKQSLSLFNLYADVRF